MRDPVNRPAVAPATADLENLLAKAATTGSLAPREIEGLLALDDADQLAALMAAARQIRQRHFGNVAGK